MSGPIAAPPLINPAANIAGLRTLGTGSSEATAGNDARLSTPSYATASPTPGRIPIAGTGGILAPGWINGEYNIKSYATGNGTTDDTAAVQAAITSAGTSLLVITPGIYKISTPLTFGAVKFDPGSVLLKAGSGSASFASSFEASTTQHFSGFAAGDITFTGPIDCVRPEWWGAVGNGITNCTTAIQSAVDSGPVTIEFPNKTFLIGTAGIVWASGVCASFNNTVFLAANRIESGSIISMTSISNILFTGCLTLKCATANVTNTKYGLVASSTSNVKIDSIHALNIPMGIELFDCSDWNISELTGDHVWGTYQTSSDQLGSMIAIIRGSRINIDSVEGKYIGKAGVYLGVSGAGDNTDISVGSINVHLDHAASYPSALGIRSGINCSFGSIKVKGGYRGVTILPEAVGEIVQNISIDSILIQDLDAVASRGIDIVGYDASHLTTGVSIGSIGVFLTTMTSGSYSNTLVNIAYSSDLYIGGIVTRNDNIGTISPQWGDGVSIANSTRIEIPSILVNTVHSSGVHLIACTDLHVGSAQIRNAGYRLLEGDPHYSSVLIDASCSRCRIDSIKGVTEGGVSDHHAWALEVLGNPSSVSFGNVVSISGIHTEGILFGDSGGTNQPILRISNGNNIHSAAPTHMSWLISDIVYNSVAAPGGNIGWTCTTAGTPGTWKEFGLISM